MQKLNQLGLELISMKQELLNVNHSEVVRKALLFHVENMTENKLIEVDTQVELTNKDMLLDDFKTYLMAKPSYMKTLEELRGEYDALRESILEKMKTDIDFASHSDVERENLTFIQTFELDVEWVKEYFGVADVEVPKLVKENGFIAKFAVLRLNKLTSEFLKSSVEKHDLVEVKRGEHLYNNIETSSYCLDLIYTVKVEHAENELNHELIASYMSDTSNAINQYVVSHLT